MKKIVWVHGFPLSAAVFDDQRSIAGIEHVMPDLPGFGSAPPPKGAMTMDDYARHVLDSFSGEAVFAGLSMGGYICFAMARLAPERMKGLILLDTRETPDTPEAAKGRYDTAAKVREQGVGVVVDAMLPKMLTPAAPEPMRERVRRIMSSSSKEGVIAALEGMAERPDSSPMLPSINVPTLIVVGDEDTITPPSDAERMARAIPNARLVKIPRAAHLANIENADAVNAAVEALG